MRDPISGDCGQSKTLFKEIFMFDRWIKQLTDPVFIISFIIGLIILLNVI